MRRSWRRQMCALCQASKENVWNIYSSASTSFLGW